jgi:hypothetical protein
MPTPYNVNPKLYGINGFGLSPCQDVYGITFAASTNESVTVPDLCPLGALGQIGAPVPFPTLESNTAKGRNKCVAIFHYGKEVAADIWVAYNQPAVVPAGDTFAKQTSELFPLAWEVYAGDTIQAITATVGAEMSISFYAIAG